MKTALTTASVVFLTVGTASAYTLDFDANGPGIDAGLDSSSTQPAAVLQNGGQFDGLYTREITDDGITWTLSTEDPGGPALFDSTCPYAPNGGCNGDADLRPETGDVISVSGNILIQQNDQESRTPNDDPSTNYLRLTLMSDVTLLWDGLSVVDDGQYDVYKMFADGTLSPLLASELIDGDDNDQNGNSHVERVTFDPVEISKDESLYIDFTRPSNGGNGDSGGIDTLTFTAVPVPAGLPLLLAAFGSFAYVKRRRKA